MSKKDKKSLWKEFTEFAIKGNAMALAVGTIIGGAFSTITKSLTDDIIMPIVNIFLGGTDFTELKVQLPREEVENLWRQKHGHGNILIGWDEKEGLTGWAKYIAKQVCAGGNADEFRSRHRWAASKGLKIPQPTEADKKISRRRVEKIAMEIGGWADDHTMRRIYTHLAKKDLAKHTSALTSFFTEDTAQTGNTAENGNENGNAN